MDKMRQPSDILPSEFADLLKLYRTDAGLTQEQLAEKAGVTVQCVSMLERGLRRRPRRETVQLLAKGLDLPLAQRAAFDRALVRPRATAPPPLALHPVVWVRPSSLPLAPNALIGRERDLEQVKRLLWEDQARLVTILGPGGVGKTRLALEVARDVAERFANGVAFASLATVTDESLVASSINQALGFTDRSGWSSRAILHDRLRDMHMLLVLDNVEHLQSCGDLIGELLASCARLHILATSRVALRVRAERRCLLRPLTTALPLEVPDLPALTHVPALALLLDRVRAVDPTFTLTVENAAPLVEICRRLDGLPLALELAAPRLRVLSPTQLLTRLSPQLNLLTKGAADLPGRQQTLQATLTWSHDLLSREEAAMFRRVAVFAGGFTLDAVEFICGHDQSESLDIDLTASLVDNSLLYRDDRGGDLPRLAMLETIREYAAGLLDVSSEKDVIRERHAAFFQAAVLEAETYLMGPDQGTWRARLDLDYDNIRAVLRWLQERDAVEDALRLTAALWRYWQLNGAATEGRVWLESFLNRDRDLGFQATSAMRTRALNGAARLAYIQNDYDKVAAYGAEVIALCTRSGDRQPMADVLNTLGNMHAAKGDYAQAEASYEESIALQRALGYEWGEAIVLNNLGALATHRGRYDEARTLHYKSLALFRAIEDVRGVGEALYRLATLAWRQGDPNALTLAKEAVTRLDDLRDQAVRPRARLTLALVLLDKGDARRAWIYTQEALTIVKGTGDKATTVLALEVVALLTASADKRVAALCMLGAAEALREAIGAPMTAFESLLHERAMKLVQSSPLDESVKEDAWSEGRSLTTQRAVARGLAEAPLQGV